MRFLFCLDLNLHAGAGNFFWNFDFCNWTRAEKRSRPRGPSYSVSCRGEARRGQGEPRTVPAGARRAAAELAGPGMRHLLSRGWDEMATNKIDGVAHCARCLCLPAFIRQPFCCPLPEMSTTICSLQLFAARSSKCAPALFEYWCHIYTQLT